MTGYETEKCITGIRRKMKIGILASIAIILCVGISIGYIRFTRGYQVFRAPEHEAAASFGVPDAADTYQELPVREGYVVGIDTEPVWNDGILSLNVANKEGNTVWFLVQIAAYEPQTYHSEGVARISCIVATN